MFRASISRTMPAISRLTVVLTSTRAALLWGGFVAVCALPLKVKEHRIAARDNSANNKREIRKPRLSMIIEMGSSVMFGGLSGTAIGRLFDCGCKSSRSVFGNAGHRFEPRSQLLRPFCQRWLWQLLDGL